MTTMETDKGQPSYSTLEPGGFVTKGADRKMRLDKRHVKIAAATGKPDEGEIEEMAQEKLEREASELTSQLKKAETSRGSGTRKGPKRQGQTLQPKDHKWEVFEETKSHDIGRIKEMKEVNEDGQHSQCGRRRRPGRHP